MLVHIGDWLAANFFHAVALCEFSSVVAITHNLAKGGVELRFIPVVSAVKVGTGYIALRFVSCALRAGFWPIYLGNGLDNFKLMCARGTCVAVNQSVIVLVLASKPWPPVFMD
jgi:hypothetical protein